MVEYYSVIIQNSISANDLLTDSTISDYLTTTTICDMGYIQ